MRVDGVLLAALAAVAGGVCAVYPAPTLLCLLAAGLLLHSGLGFRTGGAALLFFVLAAARGAQQIQDFEATRILLRDALGPPSRCDLSATVAGSPVWSDGSASFVAEVTRADCESRLLPVPFRARLHGGPDGLARADRVHVIADLAPVQLFRNLDTADPTPAAARQRVVLSGGVLSLDVTERHFGLRTLLDRARARARRRIALTFAPAATGMARALVLGESDLAPEDAQAFQKSGLSHMLAVSGTHLVFAVVALVHALTFLLARVERLAARFVVARFASGVGLLLALIYADFAGGSSSAWRAAFMLSIAFLARALGRKPLTVRSFGLSTLVFALLDPLCAFDLSFMLSVAATAGLIWLGQPLAARCERIDSRPLRFLITSFATTLSATIPCVPLLALLASGVTLAGLVANVLAAPLGESIALPLCLTHLLLSPIPPLERGAALVASGALLVVKRIAWLSADASWLSLTLPEPGRFQLSVIAVFVLGCALRGSRFQELGAGIRRRLLLAWAAASLLAFFALELAARRAGAPKGVFRASALDVGQGDSNLLDLPDGSCILIDGGGFVGSPVDPGKAVVLPVLRARRRKRVDVLVLSHPHPDHFTGLASAIEQLEIGEFWDSGQGEAQGAGPGYAELLRTLRARGVPIRHPEELCGRPRDFAGARVSVLAPCPSFLPERGANDNSLVISVSYGQRRFLFTGDAEQEEEAQLVREHGLELRADYLKVGHHGSRTSTGEAFLALVAPSLATLSCGVRNRFGHPHLPTLERLRAHQVRALRLDRSGSVEVTSDGRSLSARATRWRSPL
ncbi:MAG TPA: DNA internalization-related competence protein ComEC/Rec2 [Polyangiaceae bacterium]|nr:DNA internalization-related competence protein ComEC/Rec2 [Polyangiaceae bacterium]